MLSLSTYRKSQTTRIALSIDIRNQREYPFGGVTELKGQIYTDAHSVEDVANRQLHLFDFLYKEKYVVVLNI